MKSKTIIRSILFSIALSVLVFFIGYNKENMASTEKLYQVYLSGEKIGLIEDDQALYKLIDKEQAELKEEYNVDKIYPPKGLEVIPVYTYYNEISSINVVYNKIKEKEPFTIEGYEVTINNDPEVKAYLLNIKDLDIAIKNTVKAFIDKEDLDNYINATQEEITDEGTIINNINLSETITTKKTLISTKNKIFKSSDELSRYMLFGTLESQSTYKVKLGDTIDKVSDNHQLNPDEFLIVNPQIVSEKALLYPGQVVNINLISPLIHVVEKETLVEKQVIKYETTIEYDNSMAAGKKYTKQTGVNGLAKATFELTKVNGEIIETENIKAEEISAPVDQIIVYGGYDLVYVGNSTYWGWPTNKPYIISSTFKWRWGRMHNGVDITGTGFGSPVRVIQNGVVLKTGYSSTSGNYIYVNHNNGYYSTYLHLSKILVSVGDTVKKGQVIGAVGNTGRSTGTHLHLGIYDVNDKKYIDPLLLYQ